MSKTRRLSFIIIVLLSIAMTVSAQPRARGRGGRVNQADFNSHTQETLILLQPSRCSQVNRYADAFWTHSHWSRS